MANTFQFSVANIFHPMETGGGDNGFISRPISVPRSSTLEGTFCADTLASRCLGFVSVLARFC